MNQTRKYVKFTGEFKNLIPAGWKFYKLFARNYRCYGYTHKDRCDFSFLVWQHLGGYIEYEDLFSNSWLIFDWVTSGNCNDGRVDFMGSTWYECLLDKDTNTIQKWEPQKYDPIYLWTDDCDEEDVIEKVKELHRRYKRINLQVDDVEFILKMERDGLFEIVPDDRPVKN